MRTFLLNDCAKENGIFRVSRIFSRFITLPLSLRHQSGLGWGLAGMPLESSLKDNFIDTVMIAAMLVALA